MSDKLEKWYKQSLWGNEAYVPCRFVLSACLAYILRRLSRRDIPDPELVFKTLNGEEKIPKCGYIGCKINDNSHVH